MERNSRQEARGCLGMEFEPPFGLMLNDALNEMARPGHLCPRLFNQLGKRLDQQAEPRYR